MLRVFSERLRLRKWDHGGAVRSCKELRADYHVQGTQLVSKGGASPFASRLLAILMWVLLDLDLKFNIYTARASRMDTASCFR